MASGAGVLDFIFCIPTPHSPILSLSPNSVFKAISLGILLHLCMDQMD